MAAQKTPTRAVQKRQKLGDQAVPISRLHLNLLNPRHEPVGSEAEAITHLCNEALVDELARDIASRGALSPLEVLGVTPIKGHPGHFVSLEGNRRTCALVLLADPKRAPPRFQDQFRRLASRANLPKKVRVYVFPDAESAKPWIDLRHLGEQGGIGTRPWNPTQQARAAGRNTRTSARANSLAVAVLDRLSEKGFITSDQRKAAAVSTLTRYLGTPGVRAILGLGDPNELVYTHDADEVDAALRQLIVDSIEAGPDGSYLVNSRSNAAGRMTYANQLKARGATPKTPLPKPLPPSELGEGTAGKDKTKSSKHPDKRPYLITSGFVISHSDTVLLRLKGEARAIKVEGHEFSANYLLRALVERIMVLFLSKRGRFGDNLSDVQITTRCAEEIRALGATRRVQTIIDKAAGSQDTPYGLHSLGHVVHGGRVPTAREVRSHFESWEPVLRFMLDAL